MFLSTLFLKVIAKPLWGLVMNKEYLWKKLGPTVQRGLTDAEVYEVMLNPDGKLWFRHKTKGNDCVGAMEKPLASAFVHALAQFENKFLNTNTIVDPIHWTAK